MEFAAKKLEREALFFRIVWMIVYGLLWQLVTPLLLLVVILQLVYRLFKGQPHAGLMWLGDGLGGFLAQIARFTCFRTDDKPWPVADWPVQQDDEPAAGE